MKKKKITGLQFWGSGTPTFWLGLLLFTKRESRTPTFKILVSVSNMASDAKTCFSSKVEYRAVIRYLYLKGNNNSAPSCAQVKFWVGEFKRGRTSLEDGPRSGRPLDATNEEMCKKNSGSGIL